MVEDFSNRYWIYRTEPSQDLRDEDLKQQKPRPNETRSAWEPGFKLWVQKASSVPKSNRVPSLWGPRRSLPLSPDEVSGLVLTGSLLVPLDLGPVGAKRFQVLEEPVRTDSARGGKRVEVLTRTRLYIVLCCRECG